MTRTSVVYAKIVTVLIVIPALMPGHRDGADPAHTGAPGDETCAKATCHVGAQNPTRGTGVEIDFPDGFTYRPGVKQRWTIRVTGAETSAYGFQVTARLASNERTGQAGGFNAVDGTTQVICLDGRVKTATANCRADAPVEFGTHTAPGRQNRFVMEWTPPATDAGEVIVYVAGNAANFNNEPTGDRIFLNSFRLAPGGSPPARPEIRTQNPVLQAFDNRPLLSGGTWLQIYGTNLSPVTREWAGSDFTGATAPTSLNGVSVKINGRNAFIRYISPTQINAQAPTDDSVGPVEVEVSNAGGSSRITMTKAKVTPALLEHEAFVAGGRKFVVALHQDAVQTFVGRADLVPGVRLRPARPGEVITLYAVGCGAPGGEVISGLRTITAPVEVTFGSTVATAAGFFAPGAVGLCQFNVTVPNIADGDSPVELRIDGVATGQNLFTTVQR